MTPEELLEVAERAPVVRQGDTLVFGFSCPVTAQHAHDVAERIKHFLPDLDVLIVDNVAAMAVVRS